MAEKIIGIDLGTTNSCVAVLEHKQALVVNNVEGGRTTPSVVSFIREENEESQVVGVAALRRSVAHPEETISSAKRLMGRQLSEVTNEVSQMPYKIVSDGENGAVKIDVGGTLYLPEQISAYVLQKIKEDTEAYLDESVSKAVITVPAYFNDAQRLATKQAAEIAGLEVLRLVNEPTAAALAYGFGQDREEKLLVFDLGGGTFDVSILEIGDDVFEVLATSGDNHLGGDDFDAIIVEHIISDFKKEQAIDLSKDNAALRRLYESAQKAKIELSTLPKSRISLPFISASDNVPVHLEMDLTRAELNAMSKPLLDRLNEPIEKALREAGLSAEDIDHVILVGGMTRMPAVEEKVVQIIGKDPHKTVNPDEAVAIGAAIQAGVLVGEIEDVLLLDVTPLSLGIETHGGMMTKLIHANSTVPARTSEVFTTAEDNQPSVQVNILQGERGMAKDNRSLGRLQLLGIPPAQAGLPQIEVTFDIDADGILSVTARDLGTNKQTETQIESATGLSDREIEDMRNRAADNRESDAEKMRIASERVKAEAISSNADKQIAGSGDMTDEEREEISTLNTELKDVLSNDNKEHPSVVSEVERLSAELFAALEEYARRIYGDSLDVGETPNLETNRRAGGNSDIIFDDEEIELDLQDHSESEVLKPNMPTANYDEKEKSS